MNGLEVAQRIQQMKLRTRVLMLSMHSAPEYVARALRVGTAGYLLKDAAVSELEKAVGTVLIGREYLSQAIDRDVVYGFLKAPEATGSELAVLTRRQREILQLVAEGNSTREIADRLFISVKTVETHRAQLMERLGITDVPGLVRLAIRTGLIAPDP
jgi:DNA-binding NarL/FixJ family response regulator